MSAGGALLLSARNLTTTFDTPSGRVRAVDGIDLDLRLGEVVCLVGESGSGKSVTGLSLMGLIDPPGQVTCETLDFDGSERARNVEGEAVRILGHRR